MFSEFKQALNILFLRASLIGANGTAKGSYEISSSHCYVWVLYSNFL